MNMSNRARRSAALALSLSLLLGLLSACGGEQRAEATAMRLRRTEGTVGVSDGAGKSLKPAEDLGLYGGYQVDTQSASYAWIDLDEVKLTKMDENSDVTIQKEGKHLTIEVKSGSLFFDITEPLADDETLDIRTSTMLVGIRGTRGWVRGYESAGWMELYLLEGTVECSVGGKTATVTAGEMASMADDGDIVVVPYPESSIPDFVLAEVRDEGAEPPEPTGGGTPDSSPTGAGEDEAPEESYEINGTLELAEGTTTLRDEEIYQDVVVGYGQVLECERTTIYGSVRVAFGGQILLYEESVICGELHLDGGNANTVNSTVEGDIYVNGYVEDGLFYAGNFELFESRAAKNIYVSGVDVILENSTVDGYVDVNNEGFDSRGSGRRAEIEKSTINGQWYEKAVVVYEFNEHAWYNRDDVTVIMGRTP